MMMPFTPTTPQAEMLSSATTKTATSTPNQERKNGEISFDHFGYGPVPNTLLAAEPASEPLPGVPTEDSDGSVVAAGGGRVGACSFPEAPPPKARRSGDVLPRPPRRSFFGLSAFGCGAGEAMGWSQDSPPHDTIDDLKLEEQRRALAEIGVDSALVGSASTATTMDHTLSASSSQSPHASLKSISSSSRYSASPRDMASTPATPTVAPTSESRDAAGSIRSKDSTRSAGGGIHLSLTPELRAELSNRPLADLISPSASTRVGSAVASSHAYGIQNLPTLMEETRRGVAETAAARGFRSPPSKSVVDRLPNEECEDSNSPSSPPLLKPASSLASVHTKSTASESISKYTASCSQSHCSGSTKSRRGCEYGSSGGELLYDLIINRDYDAIYELIKTPVGRDMALSCHPHGDGEAYPLHLLCDYDLSALRKADLEGREKARKEGFLPPPADIVLAILEAHPEVARKRGPHGRLPLHHAARLWMPGEVVLALIRAYPKGLDVRDRTTLCDGKRGMTPRDFTRRDAISEGHRGDGGRCDDDPILWNGLLNRPSSCWMQQMQDEDNQVRMDAELVSLEREADDLATDLERCLAEEAELGVLLGQIEADVRRFELSKTGNDLERRAFTAEEVVTSELKDLEESIKDLTKRLVVQYDADAEERKYMADFGNDVKAVYEDVKGAMEEVKSELRELKLAFFALPPI